MRLRRQIASSNGLLDPPALIRRQHFATVNAVDKIYIYDVAIIGGGPAGSTAATLLARAGRKVVVFEREKFPRFHIGESLLPFSMKAFRRMDLLDKFERAGFLRKYGGEFFSACGNEGVKFYFKDAYKSQTDHSYQVTRSDFDKLLLDHARESGADVREQTAVKRVDFSPNEVVIEWKDVRRHPS